MAGVFKVSRPPVALEEAVQPDAWRAVSRRLLISARLLWKPLEDGLRGFEATHGTRTQAQYHEYAVLMEHAGAFFVLAGGAVENALKALLLKQALEGGRIVRTEDDLIDVVRKSHNLIALAKRAGLELSEGEARLLGRLATYVVWAGRYPFPVQAPTAPDLDKHQTRDHDWREITAFIKKLETL